MFNVSTRDQHDTSKMLTIANQSEFAFNKYISVACFVSIKTNSRYLMILFAVADFKKLTTERLSFRNTYKR